MLAGVARAFVDGRDIGLVLPSGEVVGSQTATVVLQFHRWRDIARVVLSPSIGLAELYADNRITFKRGGVYDLLLEATKSPADIDMPSLMRLGNKFHTFLQPLTEGWLPRLSQRNVSRHYDLGNDLYRLFLDKDWQYSCAYFDEEGITLEQAQHRKKDHIARKMRLTPDASVLDIGCGWGGMALHLAPHVAQVKGITLSEEQIAYARERTRGNNKISLELQDYRREKGVFDRIVSVGMLEHVGRRHYGTFFKSVSNCLAEDGVALIHTIGRPKPTGGTDPFIRKYIFPGGYIPSLNELTRAIEQTDLVVADVESLFLHYAETLRNWRERFLANKNTAVAMMGEHFARIWEFYLAGSEVSFRNGHMMVFQIQVLKPAAGRPATRGYLYPEG